MYGQKPYRGFESRPLRQNLFYKILILLLKSAFSRLRNRKSTRLGTHFGARAYRLGNQIGQGNSYWTKERRSTSACALMRPSRAAWINASGWRSCSALGSWMGVRTSRFSTSNPASWVLSFTAWVVQAAFCFCRAIRKTSSVSRKASGRGCKRLFPRSLPRPSPAPSRSFRRSFPGPWPAGRTRFAGPPGAWIRYLPWTIPFWASSACYAGRRYGTPLTCSCPRPALGRTPPAAASGR